jgi:hypothetical protein
VLEDVQAKLPATEADPPLKLEDARVCPYVIGLAVGQGLTVGVALETVTATEPMTVL